MITKISRRAKFGIGFVVASVALCGLAYPLLFPKPTHQTIQLPRGMEAELLGYSFGKSHVLRMPHHIQHLSDLLYIWRRTSSTDTVVASRTTPRDALVLWVKVPLAYSGLTGYARSANGFRYPYIHQPYRYSMGNGLPLDSIEIDNFPHGDAHLVIDLINEYGSDKVLGTLHIDNPNPQTITPFQSETLPATKRQQDLQVTLNGVEGYQWLERDPYLQKATDRNEQELNLSYNYRGKPDSDWVISQLNAIDAEGNQTRESNSTEAVTHFTPPTAETPYKVSLEVHKSEQHQLDPDETWVVDNVPLPSQGVPIALQGKFDRSDMHIQLLSVYGMDGQQFPKDVVVLKMKVTGTFHNPINLLQIEDEHGNRCLDAFDISRQAPKPYLRLQRGDLTLLKGANIGVTGSYYDFCIAVHVPTGSNHLKLHFKLPRVYQLEFTAPPFWAPSN